MGTIGGVLFLILLIIGVILYRKYRVTKRPHSQIEINEISPTSFGIIDSNSLYKLTQSKSNKVLMIQTFSA